jgi:hypothetical protein
MKHALSAPLLLFVLLAGCAADQQGGGAQNVNFITEFTTETKSEEVRESLLISPPGPASASPEGDRKSPTGETKGPSGETKSPTAETKTPDAEAKPKQREASEATREQHLRRERQLYAQGLEKILVANGMSVGVLVYDGQAGPTPTLMFVGSLSRDFVQRAVTTGAVLERAKALGFRSVDFFDRGPDSHYQFVLSKTGPLPKCAAYNRLCL